MNYKVKLNKKFTISVKNICDYIEFVLYQPNAAARFAKQIDDSVSILPEYPFAYPLCEDKLGREGFRKIVVGNYIIIYTVNEKTKTVTLLNCVYARSDYQNKI